MLGFFKWFKPGTRMKRWLFVILRRNYFAMLWNSNNNRYEGIINT